MLFGVGAAGEFPQATKLIFSDQTLFVAVRAGQDGEARSICVEGGKGSSDFVKQVLQGCVSHVS
jgi:hypothetical protein